MSKKIKVEATSEEDELSNIFSKIQIKDNKVKVSEFSYDENYLSTNITINTEITRINIEIILIVTLKDMKNFILGKKNEIEYRDEFTEASCLMTEDTISYYDKDGTEIYSISTNNITIKTIARMIFNKMIEECYENFYNNCTRGFLYYEDDHELKDDLDIMITEFTKLGYKIDITRCAERVQQMFTSKTKKQSRKYDHDDEEN
jgi:hypothetical protein